MIVHVQLVYISTLVAAQPATDLPFPWLHSGFLYARPAAAVTAALASLERQIHSTHSMLNSRGMSVPVSPYPAFWRHDPVPRGVFLVLSLTACRERLSC